MRFEQLSSSEGGGLLAARRWAPAPRLTAIPTAMRWLCLGCCLLLALASTSYPQQRGGLSGDIDAPLDAATAAAQAGADAPPHAPLKTGLKGTEALDPGLAPPPPPPPAPLPLPTPLPLQSASQSSVVPKLTSTSRRPVYPALPPGAGATGPAAASAAPWSQCPLVVPQLSSCAPG